MVNGIYKPTYNRGGHHLVALGIRDLAMRHKKSRSKYVGRSQYVGSTQTVETKKKKTLTKSEYQCSLLLLLLGTSRADLKHDRHAAEHIGTMHIPCKFTRKYIGAPQKDRKN